jgi:hypothetical protein
MARIRKKIGRVYLDMAVRPDEEQQIPPEPGSLLDEIRVATERKEQTKQEKKISRKRKNNGRKK